MKGSELDSSGSDGDKWRTLVNMVIKLRFPLKPINFYTNSAVVSFQTRTLLYGVGIQIG